MRCGAALVKVDTMPPDPHKPNVTLPVLALLAGVGGMAVSFLFLASRHPLDVIAGAVGLIAGSILTAAGLLSLALLSRSPKVGETASHVTWCLVGFAPPLVAILSWPVLYFSLFLMALPLIVLALLCCIGWAWLASDGVAANLAVLLSWRRVRVLRFFLFTLQVVAILASWPLFVLLLDLLESMGYKVGWS